MRPADIRAARELWLREYDAHAGIVRLANDHLRGHAVEVRVTNEPDAAVVTLPDGRAFCVTVDEGWPVGATRRTEAVRSACALAFDRAEAAVLERSRAITIDPDGEFAVEEPGRPLASLEVQLSAVLDRLDASGIVIWRDSRVGDAARKVRLAIIADPSRALPTIEAESLPAALLKLAAL